MKNKKGSLELSINAIVILVLAITMLGLGIAFTKGKFSQLSERIEIPEPNLPATAEEPIILTTNEITVSSNKDTIFSTKVYNDGALGTGVVLPAMSCDCDLDTAVPFDTIINPKIHFQEQKISVGEDKLYKVSVDALGADYSGATCLCSITVMTQAPIKTYATKQLTMNIK